jgi:hypothetical protein
MPPWESTLFTPALTGQRPDDAAPCQTLAREPETLQRAQYAGGGSSGGRGGALDGVRLLVVVLAIVGGILGATVVLLAGLDRAVEVVRLQLVTGRAPAASVARRLRLPLAAMLPSVMFGSLAGVTTESPIAGLATLGAIAAAMMAVLLVLRR